MVNISYPQVRVSTNKPNRLYTPVQSTSTGVVSSSDGVKVTIGNEKVEQGVVEVREINSDTGQVVDQRYAKL